MAQVEIIAANLKTNIKNSVKKIIKRVCAYCRVSTDSEEQQTSYNSQIAHYSTMIKSNPDWKFVGVYADEGITGTQIKKRTEFQRMIEDALNGKIDIIIAKSISRFARNTVDTLNTVRQLREHNVDVYFEKENIHTLELDSEMFLTLYSAFAQGESESTSMNVKMGLKAKMKRGEYVGRANPYGYNWNKETQELSINEEQAEIVRKIFNWYASGIGCKTISKKLNALNIPSPGGKKWSQQYIRTMLDQEKYIGDLMGQKCYTISPLSHKKMRNYGEKERYYSKDRHEAIITRDTWDKVHEILSKRKGKSMLEGKQHSESYSMRYAFSSKIVCSFCGNNYVRRASGKNKEGKSTIYWGCCKKVDKSECNDSKYIREDVLQNIFIQVYNSMVDNKHKTKDKLLQAIKSVVCENDTKIKIEKLEIQENNIREKLSNLLDLKLDNYIDKEVYIEKEKELKIQLEDVLQKKVEYENLDNEKNSLAKRIKEIEKVLNAPIKLKEFDRDTFDSIVEKIIIGEIDNKGNKNNNVIRFVLKTGVGYRTLIDNLKNNNNGNNNVSLEQGNRVRDFDGSQNYPTINSRSLF